jgi:hypothetical protein
MPASLTADAGEDLIGRLPEQTVAEDNGVFARDGRVNQVSHGQFAQQ